MFQIFTWKRLRRDSTNHGFIWSVSVCQLQAWLKCEPGLRWVTPDGSQMGPVRVFTCAWNQNAEDSFMYAFSLLTDNHHGSLIMPLHAISGTTRPGHWLMNKSQAVLSPPPLSALTMATRGLMHWSYMTAIWRFTPACLCSWACEEERRQVSSPWSSSACITATPVTDSPRISCGLCAQAKQTKLLFPQEWLTTSAVWFMQIQQLDLDCNGNQKLILTNEKKNISTCSFMTHL